MHLHAAGCILWVLVALDLDGHDLILLTNVPLETADDVRVVYADGRLRGRIEHSDPFDPEDSVGNRQANGRFA
jgi:hypothetical protein